MNSLALPAPWNDVADGYTSELVPFLSHYAQDAIAVAALPPDAHVLDVAAGPGTLALLAAPQAGRVVAVDFAEAMVATLEQRATVMGHSNVEVYQADGQALPFEDAMFDGAFSMFGVIFFPDRAAGFRELWRMLRPDRRAVVSSWTPPDRVPLFVALYRILGDLLPDLPFGEGKAPLSDEDELRAEMEDAGFRNVEIHTVAHTLTVPSMATFWASNARSSAPLSLLKKRFTEAEWEQLGADLVARLEAEFGTEPIEARWPARLGVGVR